MQQCILWPIPGMQTHGMDLPVKASLGTLSGSLAVRLSALCGHRQYGKGSRRFGAQPEEWSSLPMASCPQHSPSSISAASMLVWQHRPPYQVQPRRQHADRCLIQCGRHCADGSLLLRCTMLLCRRPLGGKGAYSSACRYSMRCASTVRYTLWHAVYGGFFILLSFAWGWAVDRERPDTGKQKTQEGYCGTRQRLWRLDSLLMKAVQVIDHITMHGPVS